MSAYSTAITRIPTAATGVYVPVKGKTVLLRGSVTLNVTNGTLNSITVKQAGRPRTRVERDQVRTVALSFPSRQDTLVFEALTR